MQSWVMFSKTYTELEKLHDHQAIIANEVIRLRLRWLLCVLLTSLVKGEHTLALFEDVHKFDLIIVQIETFPSEFALLDDSGKDFVHLFLHDSSRTGVVFDFITEHPFDGFDPHRLDDSGLGVRVLFDGLQEGQEEPPPFLESQTDTLPAVFAT